MASKIATLAQLKSLASTDGGVEVFVLLAEGVRIVKRLWYFPPTNSQEEQWDIYTEMGDHYEEAIDFETLRTCTMVIEALKAGTLFMYD